MMTEYKRLGVLVPSANVVMEPDMYRMVPDGITVHFSRVVVTEDTPEQVARMIDDVPRCCEELSHGKMDVYAFGCTAGSFYGGVGYDERIIDIMEEVTKKSATTTSTAALEALRHLNVRSISIVTPYEDWLNERAKAYFEGNGFKVLNIKGLGIKDPEELASQEPETIYQLVRDVDHLEAEAIFISCTDFRGVDVIDDVEKELGKPIVSSNQATMWHMLKLCGIRESIMDYGKLLAEML
jgi:maleate isomerase